MLGQITYLNMATPRTTEQLEEYLKAFKQKKQRQKQREREQKKKATKEKQSQLKRVEKLKKELYVQQLINTHVKPFQKPPEPVKHISLINVGIGDFDEETLFLTRTELQQWEIKHYPCIDWLYWDYLVEKVRNEIL